MITIALKYYAYAILSQNAQELLKMLCVILLEDVQADGSAVGSVICRMPTDLLVELAVLAMHGYWILNFRTYM